MSLLNKTISGNYVQLKSVTREDFKFIHSMYQDEKTTEQAKYYYKISLNDLTSLYEERISLVLKGESLDLLIRRSSTNQVIGTCGFKTINDVNKSAYFGVMIHHKFWGTKAVLESLYLCFEYFFETLAYHKLETSAFTTNMRSQSILNRFINVESIQKNVMLIDGEQKDNVVYIITIEDWLKMKEYLKRLIFPKDKN